MPSQCDAIDASVSRQLYLVRVIHFDHRSEKKTGRRTNLLNPPLAVRRFCVRICVRHPLRCVISIRTPEHAWNLEKLFDLGSHTLLRQQQQLGMVGEDMVEEQVESWHRMSARFRSGRGKLSRRLRSENARTHSTNFFSFQGLSNLFRLNLAALCE